MARGALEGPRLMSKNVPSTLAVYGGDAGGREWTVTNGWVPIEQGANYGIYHESYWDLSGYTADKLTTVPSGISLQDGMAYFLQGYEAAEIEGYQYYLVDIVSQERIDPLAVFTDCFGNGEQMGSPDTATRTDWTQSLFYQIRYMCKQTDYISPSAPTFGKQLLLPATGGEYGSASPTTVEKLWLYRIIVPMGVDPIPVVYYNVPATRFVMAADIVKEADLEFLMRQKRSYELKAGGTFGGH